jgi:hypothetical protein
MLRTTRLRRHAIAAEQAEIQRLLAEAEARLARLKAIATVGHAPAEADTITRLNKEELEQLREELEDVERAQRAAASDSEKLFFG